MLLSSWRLLLSPALLVFFCLLGASKNEHAKKEPEFGVKITFSDQDWYQMGSIDSALTLLPGTSFLSLSCGCLCSY